MRIDSVWLEWPLKQHYLLPCQIIFHRQLLKSRMNVKTCAQWSKSVNHLSCFPELFVGTKSQWTEQTIRAVSFVGVIGWNVSFKEEWLSVLFFVIKILLIRSVLRTSCSLQDILSKSLWGAIGEKLISVRAAALNIQTVESKYNWNGFILLESMIKHPNSQMFLNWHSIYKQVWKSNFLNAFF